MKAIREWWRRMDEIVQRYDAALADRDPWEVFDLRLSAVVGGGWDDAATGAGASALQ